MKNSIPNASDKDAVIRERGKTRSPFPNPKTAAALAELGRAAARHAGIPDDVEITMTICPDREYSWCGLVDGEPIAVVDPKPERKRAAASSKSNGPNGWRN